MPDIHEVLRWANRTKVAEEITRRGYSVSQETLNRWHRDRAELPAIVERIVFELFGITGHDESAPAWAEALKEKVDAIYERQETVATSIASSASQKLIEALADPERLAWAERIAEGIRAASGTQSDEATDDPPASGAPGAAGPGGRGLGSSHARAEPE